MSYAAGRYTQLTSDRDPYLFRGRQCAKLTIPALLPEDGSTASRTFYTPYQSLGARGVNNLASKLLLTLLPPSASFFRLNIDEYAAQELSQQDGQLATINTALGRIERTCVDVVDASPLRTVFMEGLKHLVTAGNVLLVLRDEEDARMFRLDKYVVCRSPNGTMIECIIKEPVAPAALDLETQGMLEPDILEKMKGHGTQATVDLFTVVKLNGKKYDSWQEICGKEIPGTRESYPRELCPYLALRFIRVDGEHYGRGYVEEYFGDLRSLEGLEKAILLGSAAAAKVLYFVNPNGTTRLKDVSNSESGDVKAGNAQDVTVMQTQKALDFQTAKTQATTLEQRLAFAFMLNSAIQRNGERVTAEEIKYMAQELEDALGGIYSILSLEFQKPLATLLLAYLTKKKRIPRLPAKSVKPVVVTGMQALGRGQDLTRLDEFINGIPTALQQQAGIYIDVANYLTRRSTALGLDQAGLVRSAQDVQAQQAAAAQQQATQTLLEKGTAPAVKGAVDAATQGGQAPPAAPAQ